MYSQMRSEFYTPSLYLNAESILAPGLLHSIFIDSPSPRCCVCSLSMCVCLCGSFYVCHFSLSLFSSVPPRNLRDRLVFTASPRMVTVWRCVHQQSCPTRGPLCDSGATCHLRVAPGLVFHTNFRTIDHRVTPTATASNKTDMTKNGEKSQNFD